MCLQNPRRINADKLTTYKIFIKCRDGKYKSIFRLASHSQKYEKQQSYIAKYHAPPKNEIDDYEYYELKQYKPYECFHALHTLEAAETMLQEIKDVVPLWDVVLPEDGEQYVICQVTLRGNMFIEERLSQLDKVIQFVAGEYMEIVEEIPVAV